MSSYCKSKESRKNRRILLVKECLNEGLTQKQIADEMGVSTGTIRRDIKELRLRGEIE